MFTEAHPNIPGTLTAATKNSGPGRRQASKAALHDAVSPSGRKRHPLSSLEMTIHWKEYNAYSFSGDLRSHAASVATADQSAVVPDFAPISEWGTEGDDEPSHEQLAEEEYQLPAHYKVFVSSLQERPTCGFRRIPRDVVFFFSFLCS